MSPLQGFLISYPYPGLTPGAILLRPFRAGKRISRQKLVSFCRETLANAHIYWNRKLEAKYKPSEMVKFAIHGTLNELGTGFINTG